jgi:hypothetical protein
MINQPRANKLKYFTANEIKSALIREARMQSLDDCFIELIHDSFKKFWIYDGATLVKDKYVPNLFSWLHDYMWRTGAGGKESDVIMRYLIEKGYGDKGEARLFYIGVRIAWFGFYKWKHKLKGNKRELTEVERECYKKARLFYSN